MTSPLESLIATGTKLWLDSVDPDLVQDEPRAGRDRGHVEPDHHLRPDENGPLRRRLG